MPMRPCEKCLENEWKYQKIDNIVRATCQLCGYEVEWEPREQSEIRCRTCNGFRQKFNFKKHKANAKYWFLWGWKCTKCGKIYNDEAAKVFKKETLCK